MSNVIMPKILPSKFALALVPFYDGCDFLYGCTHRLDYKLLERNKYAPWGRGSASKMK